MKLFYLKLLKSLNQIKIDIQLKLNLLILKFIY